MSEVSLRTENLEVDGRRYKTQGTPKITVEEGTRGFSLLLRDNLEWSTWAKYGL